MSSVPNPPDNQHGQAPDPAPEERAPIFLVTDEETFLEAPDGPFWELSSDEEETEDLLTADAANTSTSVPAAPPIDIPSIAPALQSPWKSPWARGLAGVAILVWLTVALKALGLPPFKGPAPVAPLVKTAVKAPALTDKPKSEVQRATDRRSFSPVKRRKIATRKRRVRTAKKRAAPRHSIILGRGAVLEDDKSIIRIRD